MDIYINQEKIDFILENEKDSYEIINGISEFASKSNPQQFITSISINNKEFSYADESNLRKILISEIRELKIETSDVYGITHLSMMQLEKYIFIIKNIFMKKLWDESLTNVEESLSWMKEGINQLVSIFGINDEFLLNEKHHFFKLCDLIKQELYGKEPLEVINNEISYNKIIDYIYGVEKSFQNIKRRLIETFKIPDRDFMVQTLKELLDKIDLLIPKLEHVPFFFQTGEDDKSMIVIQEMADIFEKCINLFILFKESFRIRMDKYTVKEVSFEDFFKTITNQLKELMEAIKNNDTVMISDLLEYEFVPNIEEVKNILKKIFEEAFTKAN